MEALILCINQGSSSTKISLYDFNLNPQVLKSQKPSICVHRLVHGGSDFYEPVQITAAVKKRLDKLIPLASLHLPAELELIEKYTQKYPKALQIACFDTAFHRQMPKSSQYFALPRRFFKQGIKRYGFHGLSYEYIVSQLKNKLGSKTIIAHLGSGCSLVALKNNIPQDTTMGFSPLGGLIMATRPGDLDPGVLLYLLKKYSAKSLESLLHLKSGWLGISGLSSDFQRLLEQEKKSVKAHEAIELFCLSVRKHIGAMAASLAGIDTLVFTGGIGANCSVIRNRICQNLEFLTIKQSQILAIPTDENWIMAQKARNF